MAGSSLAKFNSSGSNLSVFLKRFFAMSFQKQRDFNDYSSGSLRPKIVWMVSLFVYMSLDYSAIVSQAQAKSNTNNGHLTINNAADIHADEVNQIYAELKNRMAKGYGLSRLTLARNYQSWKRFNSAPYLSATHGQRFVNNYANHIGRAYGTLKDGERFPEGTVLAKDSITIMDNGKFFPGALFIMEKLRAGKSPDTADWRYVVVNPDGSLYGDTTGELSELVAYCHTCHQAKSNKDYVFFIPEEYRINNRPPR